MQKTPGPDVIAVWTRLVRAHASALSGIEARLKAAGLPALEWYDVLLELETGGQARPRDLQARLLLPQSNLSRLLDRMESAGMVTRGPCPGDRRGQLVEISEAGRALRVRMWPTYAAGIDEAVGQRLPGPDLVHLTRLLTPLIQTTSKA